MLTAKNIHNYKTLEIDESREAQLKQFYNQLEVFSKTVKKESIIPLNGNVIVKVTSPKSKILLGVSNDADAMEIWKVSRQVGESKPDVRVGMNCFVPLIDGISRPCYYEDDQDNEYVYVSVSSEQLVYAYEKKSPDLIDSNGIGVSNLLNMEFQSSGL